ncbi:MAG: efflux RND transporter permease subunit [Alistipes sp.]|nr:efflux RND transporter permease subunit [Alistipes sp.]
MGNYFVRRPIFAISIALAMTLLGAVSLSRLSIEQFPDITPPVVQVSATYVGADAQTVNNTVATPLAESVMGVSDMLYMQTTSANDGTMNMQITFDIDSSPDMDAIFTQNNVSSAMAKLPASVTQQGVVTQKSNTGFIMVYALVSDGRYDDVFLSNYAYINLEDRIAKINGVGKVSIMGAGEYAMRIWISPEKLHYYGLSLDQVLDQIKSQSAIYPSGKFGAQPNGGDIPYTYTVTLPPQITTAEEFSQIILSANPAGEQIRLKDVAQVELGSQTYSVSSKLGENPSTMIVIYQEPGSNAVDVGRKVKAVMAEQVERFPDGVELKTIVDSTVNIKAGAKDIARTLIIALLLVIIIIYLFLQSWRATLIPLIAIPVSLISTFMLFPLLGFSLNVVSLLGMVLAIGLVVDDAIVVVEAVQVNIDKGMDATSATIDAMRKVSSPIVATTVVLLAIFIPVSFTGGITGRLFQQFSVTVATSVFFSALNALTLSPALAAILLKKGEGVKGRFFLRFDSWFEQKVERYSSLTSRMIKHIARTTLFVGICVVMIGLCWKFLPKGFLPDEDEGYLIVSVTTPEASSLSVTLEAMHHIDQIISSHKEVKFSALAAGYNMIAGIASTNSGVIFVVLDDYSERKITSAELADMLTKELYMAVPEAQSYAFIPPSIPGLGIASGVEIQVQDLQGRGTRYLLRNAERLMDTLRTSDLIASVSSQFSADIPQQRIEINRAQALSQGVNLSEVYNALATYLGGSYVGNFTRFGRLYQTYLQAEAQSRANKHSLNNLYVVNNSGESVPLAAFVTVRDTVGVEYITQYNLYESIQLTVTPSQKASSSQVMSLIENMAKETLPDDVGYAWSGMSYQEANASQSGYVAYLLALFFAFLALSALYNSWSLPMAIMMSVPVAILGALLATIGAHLFEAHYINNIYMQISLVLLIGLAAKNAILVVEYADTIFHSKSGITLAEAALIAAKERVRPIIMTASAFILGVMPLVFASGIYSTARNIMGVALVGGMLLATFIGIFLYPATYYLVAKVGKFDSHKEKIE